MDVFVVEKGSKHEGGGVVAIFSRYDLAEVCAQRIMREETERCIKLFEGDNCPYPPSAREATGVGVWKEVTYHPKAKRKEWQDATEYVSITEMPVLTLVIP
jgi:hypothetical protein